MRKTNLVRCVVAMALVTLFAAVTAEAQTCRYDVTGDWYFDNGLGRWVFSGDGVVTHDPAVDWWADDATACYYAHRNSSFFVYFSQCDLDASGAVELDEVQEVSFNAWPGPQPSLLSASVCMEATESGPYVFCTLKNYERTATDRLAILMNYPSTRAISDPNTVAPGGQGWSNYTFDTILCSFANDVPVDLFADLNACYGATSRCLFQDPTTGLCGQVWPEFPTAVDVAALLSQYDALAGQEGGVCELNATVGGPGGTPLGFHFYTEAGGWWQWVVRSTAQCSGSGCECDKTVRVRTHPQQPFMLEEDSVIDNSTPACNDSRF